MSFKTNISFQDVVEYITQTHMEAIIHDELERRLCALHLDQLKAFLVEFDMYEINLWGALRDFTEFVNEQAVDDTHREIHKRIVGHVFNLIYQATLRLTVEKERERLMDLLEIS